MGAVSPPTPVLCALHPPPLTPQPNPHSRSLETHSSSPTTCCWRCHSVPRSYASHLVDLSPLSLRLRVHVPGQWSLWNPHQCIQIYLPNITTIRSSSTTAKSTANDASQLVGASAAKQSPENGPESARKRPMDKVYRPQSSGRARAHLSIVHPSVTYP